MGLRRHRRGQVCKGGGVRGHQGGGIPEWSEGLRQVGEEDMEWRGRPPPSPLPPRIAVLPPLP